MIAIDTNILVRILVEDAGAPEQTAAAYQLVKDANTVFVPQLVQAELVWVLQRAYQFDKSEILLILETLKSNPAYQLQHRESFLQALERFKSSNAGFADALIAVESRNEHKTLWTFDKKLSKQEGVSLLTTIGD